MSEDWRLSQTARWCMAVCLRQKSQSIDCLRQNDKSPFCMVGSGEGGFMIEE